MISINNQPLTKEEFNKLKVILSKYSLIKGYCLDYFERLINKGRLSREYPLVRTALKENDEFLKIVDDMIKFHKDNKTKGLKGVMDESMNKEQFYHSLSQLEHGKNFINRGFKIELIKSGDSKKPDLLIEKGNLKIYIEIKTLREYEFMNLLIDSIYNIESDYILDIQKHPNCTNKNQVDKFRREVKERLENPGNYDLSKPLEIEMGDNLPPFATVKFIKKDKKSKVQITPSIAREGVVQIDGEFTQKKFYEILSLATEQLYNNFKDLPKFVLFDLTYSTLPLIHHLDDSDFRKFLYAERLSVAPPIQKMDGESKKRILKMIRDDYVNKYNVNNMDKFCFRKGFEKICKEFLISKRNHEPDKLVISGIITKRGLYFNPYYKYLNGVIFRKHNRFFLYPNPFVSKGILIDEDRLYDLFLK